MGNESTMDAMSPIDIKKGVSGFSWLVSFLLSV